MSPLMTAMVMTQFVLCSAVWGAPPDRLLSRHATYRLVIGAGYCYTNQVQPGVNVRMPKEAIVYTTLVKQTDTGDLLIDGDTDGKTMVYTPGSWPRHWMIIVVEMKLPGPSKLNRVDVYLPEAVSYQPESVALCVRTSSGTWGKIASMVSKSGPRDARIHTRKLTFPLDNMACQDFKIVCSDNRGAANNG